MIVHAADTTKIHTVVDYHGQQIYIYKLNDTNHRIYYYVPIVFPEKKLNTSWIWTSGRGELRLNLMFGNDEIDEIVRKKIVKTGETGLFDVAPLIIDSFSAFIVSTHDEPVLGVHSFHRTHPNGKTMTIRFQCSSENVAHKVMTHIIDGDYDIEFAFFFADLNKNTAAAASMSTITSNSLRNVLLKTVADGEYANAIYIDKEQINKFVSNYSANVIKIIYKDDSSLIVGLHEDFMAITKQQVYKLTDIVDNLQVVLMTRELIAMKTNGAMIRTLNTLDLTNVLQLPTILTGEIRLYSSDKQPPFPWLFCNGAAISRIEYQRLFDVIGTKYGNGDGLLTFNLPDFRGRIPVGVDELAIRVHGASNVGLSGGASEHSLSVTELPAHQHDQGTFAVTTNGDHTHSYSDPGHAHQFSLTVPTVGDKSHPWHVDWGDGFYHNWQLSGTSVAAVGIQINNAGAHSHSISGQTGLVGSGQNFTLMNPFQVVTYIIYSN